MFFTKGSKMSHLAAPRIQVNFYLGLEVFINIVFIYLFVRISGADVVLRAFGVVPIVGFILGVVLLLTAGQWTAAPREDENRFCGCYLRLLVEWLYDHTFGGKIPAAVVVLGWLATIFTLGAYAPLSECVSVLLLYMVCVSIVFSAAEDPIKQLQRKNTDAEWAKRGF